MAELERSRKEIEASIMRKENEISSTAAKLDDEQGTVSKTQKSIREYQASIDQSQLSIPFN